MSPTVDSQDWKLQVGYDQMKEDHPSTWKGEDNWRYVQEDYARWPAKPTIDGEP